MPMRGTMDVTIETTGPAPDPPSPTGLRGLLPRSLFTRVTLIIVVGLISAILPLLRNIRRNPIRDMRDE